MAHRGGGPEGPIDVVWMLYSRLAKIVERLDRLTESSDPVSEGYGTRSRPRLQVVEDDGADDRVVAILAASRPRSPEPCEPGQPLPGNGPVLVAEDGLGG